MLVLFLVSLLLRVDATPTHHIAFCIFPEGNVLFSDLPCPLGSESRTWQNRATVIDFGPVPRPQSIQRPHTKQRNLATVIKPTRKERCQTAIQGLRDLRMLRRGGYKLTEEQALDKSERALKVSKRQFC